MNFLNPHKIPVLMLAGFFLTLSLVGCGAKQYRRVEQSGFLGDYSKMKEGSGNEALYVYINPRANCKKYNKVIIDPVILWDKPDDSSLSSLDAEDQKMLRTFGWGTLYDGFRKGKFQVVYRPGPDVMEAKAAITEAVKAKVLLADVLAGAPYAWEAATLWGIGTGKWPFLGELAAEMEISDSVTKERLFASVDKVVGTLGSNIDPTAGWDDVRQGFDFWRDRGGQRMESCKKTGSFKMPKDERNWLEKIVRYLAP